MRAKRGLFRGLFSSARHQGTFVIIRVEPGVALLAFCLSR